MLGYIMGQTIGAVKLLQKEVQCLSRTPYHPESSKQQQAQTNILEYISQKRCHHKKEAKDHEVFPHKGTHKTAPRMNKPIPLFAVSHPPVG